MKRDSPDAFHTTHWTLVRKAGEHSEAGRQALSELCGAYYEPVVAFLRGSGREADAARDLAHGFFAQLLEKPNLGGAEPGRGRFRNYLLGALKHYLGHRRQREERQKRGGGIELVPSNAGTDTTPGVELCDPLALPPDMEFDRQWALHVLKQAMTALEAEWKTAGKTAEFARLRPFLAGDPEHGELAALANRLGIPAATLRKDLSRMRQRFRQHVKATIAPTLAQGLEPGEEMRQLLVALAPGSSPIPWR